MKTKAVTFVGPWEVSLKAKDVDYEKLKDEQILIDTLYSVISQGTELAILSGNESWAPLPCVPRYGSVGKIKAIGKVVKDFKIGDVIFNYGPHQAVAIASGLVLPVPKELDPKLAVLARMAQVSFTPVRLSDAELGDMVAVQGLGLVGNIAAQLFTMSGCTVIGIDISKNRLAAAHACGIAYTVNTKETDPVAAVREVTGGAMCQTVVEATGIPDMVLSACKLAGKQGEVILTGSPRGKFTANTVELLNQVHLWGNCITLKGAHEWRYPMYHDCKGFVKHSLERNIRQMFDFTMAGKLHITELISHVVEPSRCTEVYGALRNREDGYLGVVFDWNKV